MNSQGVAERPMISGVHCTNDRVGVDTNGPDDLTIGANAQRQDVRSKSKLVCWMHFTVKFG
jgi:hypothetical protein